MTALDAFLPTTAALHRHLAAETEPEPTPDRKDPVLTKYIVVATKSGHEVPILAPQVDGLNHSDLVPDNCTPVSAGFAMSATLAADAVTASSTELSGFPPIALSMSAAIPSIVGCRVPT